MRFYLSYLYLPFYQASGTWYVKEVSYPGWSDSLEQGIDTKIFQILGLRIGLPYSKFDLDYQRKCYPGQDSEKPELEKHLHKYILL